jgi:hypothetical protein
MRGRPRIVDLADYYWLRHVQCAALDEARECFDRSKRPNQGMIMLLEWGLCKYEADEMMENLNKHWLRLHGQMNGKVGAT